MSQLTEQYERIQKAGRALVALPAWYLERRKEWHVHAAELLCGAYHANQINGDFETAEGRLNDLNEGIEMAREKIADWGSD